MKPKFGLRAAVSLLPLLLAACGGGTAAQKGPAVAIPAPAPAAAPPVTAPPVVAALPEAAKPAPTQPNPAQPEIWPLARYHGINGSQITQRLGAPRLIRREDVAEIWQYQGKDCVVDFYFYSEINNLRIHFAEARAAGWAALHQGKPGPSDDSCLLAR